MPQYYDLNAVESESIMIGNDWDFLWPTNQYLLKDRDTKSY